MASKGATAREESGDAFPARRSSDRTTRPGDDGDGARGSQASDGRAVEAVR